MKNFVLLINIFFEFYNQLLLSVKLSIYFGHKELGIDSETREQGMKKVWGKGKVCKGGKSHGR